MTYINVHFKELKFSIFYSIFTIFVSIIVIYDYIDIFISYYIYLTDKTIHFIFTDIMEVFLINIKLSILFGIIFSIPSVILLIWLYIKPGLYAYENNFLKNFYILHNSILFYYSIYIVPNISLYIIDYLNKLSLNNFEYYDITLYQRFYNFYSLIFNLNIWGLIFLLFIISFITIIIPYYTMTGRIDNLLKTINKQRKYMYFSCLFILALITPPDILSLILIFIPLLIIIEILILIICLYNNLRSPLVEAMS